jgi:organic radical activating enzyme
MQKTDPHTIGSRIIDHLKNEHNPRGLFAHPSGQPVHMCFTGGEPLMKHAQECVIGVLDYFERTANVPKHITFETNATQKLTPDFIRHMSGWRDSGGEIFISSSPKLFSTSGEVGKDAIHPEILSEYSRLSKGHGQMKFVVNGKKETWDELDHVVNEFRKVGVYYPVWIMPVGATEEGQTGELENYTSAGKIAEEAFKRGYNVSARVHVYLWGNTIGV